MHEGTSARAVLAISAATIDRLLGDVRVAASGGDDGDLSAYQIARKVGQPIVIALRPAVFDPHILALDQAGFPETLAE